MLELDHNVFVRLMTIFNLIMLFGLFLVIPFFFLWDMCEKKVYLFGGVLTSLIYVSFFVYRAYVYVIYGI